MVRVRWHRVLALYVVLAVLCLATGLLVPAPVGAVGREARSRKPGAGSLAAGMPALLPGELELFALGFAGFGLAASGTGH